MSVIVRCLLKDDRLDWTYNGVDDFQDILILQFILPCSRAFTAPAAASDFAANLLRPKARWCFFGSNGQWVVDFDKLRQEVPEVNFPDWLTGAPTTIAAPRRVWSHRPTPGVPSSPDLLEITCRYFLASPDPTLEACLEVLNSRTELVDSLSKFRQHFAAPERVAFVMMRFESSRLNNEIYEAVQKGLREVNFEAVRADYRAFHENLFENVQTYMHGCRFGIAVYDRLSTEQFNPNVSLEVGYMMALQKPVCLLKDQTLHTLNTDLMGRIYRAFDTHSPGETIPPQLKSWMTDKDLLQTR